MCVIAKEMAPKHVDNWPISGLGRESINQEVQSGGVSSKIMPNKKFKDIPV